MSASSFFEGGHSFKFDNIGDTITGVVTSEPSERQQTKFNSTELKFFRNGEKAMMLVINLQTSLRDDNDDDGMRLLYVNKPSNMYDAVRKALRDIGAKQIEPGQTFTVTYTGKGTPFVPTAQPPKAFDVKILPANGSQPQAQGTEQAQQATQTQAAQPQVNVTPEMLQALANLGVNVGQ